MSSVHEVAAREAFSRTLAEDGFEAAYGAAELGRRALWCQDAGCGHTSTRPVVGQTFGPGETLEQLWCRGQLEALLFSGRAILACIPAGSGPGPDKDAEQNQHALSFALAGTPASVSVWPSTGGVSDDGRIEWPGALTLTPRIDVRCLGQVWDAPAEVQLEDTRIALEIGYTLPSRTFWHLHEHGAVWRWPYGSDHLWLLALPTRYRSGWRLTPLSMEQSDVAGQN